MNRTSKILLAASIVVGLNACAVVPYGPHRAVVTVAPPVLVGPGPVVVGPVWGGPRYYGGYGGGGYYGGGYYGRGYYGGGYRHWH
jgi:uncharacterized membrane protein